MVEPITGTRITRWHRRAERALHGGNIDAADRACKRLLELDPNHADAIFIAGVCAAKRGNFAEALPFFEKSTAEVTDRPEYWAQLAHCLAQLGQYAEALTATERAIACSPADAVTQDVLGVAFTLAGRHAEATERFRLAAQSAPKNAEYQYHFATSLTFCGDLERADHAFERVLKINPHHLMTHLALAENLDSPPPPGRLELLEATLSHVLGDVDAELIVHHALGRTLEACGEHDRAMAHWVKGKQAKKSQVGYEIGQDKALFQAIEGLFNQKSISAANPGLESSAPIFVIGMPRTGTTLTERILSSHSAISPGGELSSFPQTIREASGERQRPLVDPVSFRKALAQDATAIAERYLELAYTLTGATGRFVDKLPLNFFYVGFIRRVLPNARIVCLHRNALDTCVASFRQLFAHDFRYYYYALSLEDTLEYYALFTQLMRHWDELFPAAVYHLHYEKLVTNFDTEVRRLFDYLELDFEESVADFSRNSAPTATASALQVRKPLSTKSVGAWKRYASALKPLRSRLTALGIGPESGICD
jgi:tetratricopeptide (TPR) repeat protein